MQRKRYAIAVGAALAFVTPTAAHAATKTVLMGLPPSAGKQFHPYDADVNAFFPTAITVHTGDTVQFAPVGFHDLDIPPRGGQPVDLIAPTGQKAASTDAAGAPFWFGGQDVLAFNPKLLKSSFGKKLTYDRSKAVLSGLPLADKPKAVTVRFTKPGSFTYFCDIHPGMKGTVRVVGKTAKVPTAAADKKAVATQVTAALKTAKKLATAPATGSAVSVGRAGAGGVERYAFVPDKLSVAPGTTVTFAMPSLSREDHTATTGPGDPNTDPGSYLGKLAASFQAPQIDPVASYPSDPPPAGAASLSPELHGNGFWNSGLLDSAGASPIPNSNRVTFTTPGTYAFYCLIHPFMKATVTVG